MIVADLIQSVHVGRILLLTNILALDAVTAAVAFAIFISPVAGADT